MEGAKRKAGPAEDDERLAKRAKHDDGRRITVTDDTVSPPAAVTLVKEGKLRMFDESTARWLDATLKLYSNAFLEWEVDRYVGKQSSMPLQVKKAGRMLVKPGLTAKPIAHADYIGVFAIQPTVSYKRRRERESLVLAAADPNEGDRWMHMINYVSLRRSTELMQHNHPLTPCESALTPIYLTSPPPVQEEKIGPSRIDSSENMFMCDYCHNELSAQHCEFCTYDICGTCANAVGDQAGQLMYSTNHPQHPLIHFRTAGDPSWFSTDYLSAYICSICKQQNTGPVHHCVECGNYDECPECFKQRAKDTHENHSMNQSIEDEQQLDIGLLSHFISRSGNEYEMIKKGDKVSPRAASMISKRCWDLTKIDEEAVPNAYFEVTVMQLEGQHMSVGVGNQIFVQNQLLGYQQNSFGFCNNGQVTQNVGTNIQHFPPFGAGDTIGVGMLLDSFNMRRLFFTKNGEYLGCFNERVHVGMDCFPGVSITTTTCQSVKFSMNTAGPFQFDTKSIPDYRQNRRNLFEQLPAELIVKCLSKAALMPQQVCEFFQNSKLKLKSWMTLYQRRLKTEERMIRERRRHVIRKEYRGGHHFIENCDFEFECPLIFEDLFDKKIETNGEVLCNKCNKTVYEVKDKETLEKYVAMGRCVSMFTTPSLPRIRPTRMGGVIAMPHMTPQAAVPKPFDHLPKRSNPTPQSFRF